MFGVGNHRLKYLVIVGVALFLMGMTYLPVKGKVQELKAEKELWQGQMKQQSSKGQSATLPTLLDLPSVLEECQSLFEEQSVHVVSVNLDRLEEASVNPTSADHSVGLSYALFHFKLLGSWNGIETSFQHLENISDQAIQIQEVRLNAEGGDSILKIYFYEPDKEPDKPILP